jgi:hypothetical protein
MEEPHHYLTGFLRDAAYMAHMQTVLRPYKDRFGDATTLTVHIDEIQRGMLSFEQKPAVQISEDGKAIVIKQTASQYYDSKGKPKGKPTPFEIFESLRSLLNKAVEEYAQKFPRDAPQS